MKYIASWSGGKDSTASIILAHERNEPLDLIIFSEVMFDKTYIDCFRHIATKGKRIGRKLGFPMSGKCSINRDCKMPQIRKFLKGIGEPFTQYIGIAVDEPVRMERIVNSGNKVSLLEKYGYTEQMAFDLCQKYDLLSPIYEFSPRGGGLLVLS